MITLFDLCVAALLGGTAIGVSSTLLCYVLLRGFLIRAEQRAERAEERDKLHETRMAGLQAIAGGRARQ